MEEHKESNVVENMLFLFSREKNLEKIMNGFCDGFGIERVEGGGQLHLENHSQIVHIDVLLEEMGEEYKSFIQRQRDEVSWYFAQRENCDEDIKINLVHHIQQSKAFIPIKVVSKRIEEAAVAEDVNMVTQIITDVMKKIDGILIISNGRVAIEHDRKVILAEDGKSDLEYYFPFEYEHHPEFLAECTERQITRRDENMKNLFDRHIYVCELPVNEDDERVQLRTKEEVVKRILGTLAVSLYSEALLSPQEQMSVQEARDFVIGVMRAYSIDTIEEVLTAKELEYFKDDTSDERTRIDFSWHYEHLYLLEWILCLADWNEPTDICDVGLMVRNLNEFESIEDICNRTTMRSKKEILDKADLIYRMDWAAVDARIRHMAAPAGLEGGVVQARHKTLNWMIRFDNEEWDGVSTPT